MNQEECSEPHEECERDERDGVFVPRRTKYRPSRNQKLLNPSYLTESPGCVGTREVNLGPLLVYTYLHPSFLRGGVGLECEICPVPANLGCVTLYSFDELFQGGLPKQSLPCSGRDLNLWQFYALARRCEQAIEVAFPQLALVENLSKVRLLSRRAPGRRHAPDDAPKAGR